MACAVELRKQIPALLTLTNNGKESMAFKVRLLLHLRYFMHDQNLTSSDGIDTGQDNVAEEVLRAAQYWRRCPRQYDRGEVEYFSLHATDQEPKSLCAPPGASDYAATEGIAVGF